MTEDKQGEMLFEIVLSALDSGFERLYWHTLRTPERKWGPLPPMAFSAAELTIMLAALCHGV